MGKQTYLAYATTGKEFEVSEALTGRGFEHWCGRAVEFVRRGKKRRAEAVETPKLPNYVFIDLTADEWHDLSKNPIKHLASTRYLLRRDDMQEFSAYRSEVDKAYAEGQRIAERGSRAEIVQFTEGQKLIHLPGRFGEQVLRFKRIVERSLEFPEIEAELEMMGQIVTVRLDPIEVRGYK